MGCFTENSPQWLLRIILICILGKEIEALSPDGQALVNFRTAITSSDGILVQWRPEDEDPCGWKGVKCDIKSKRVIALSLPNHKLSGPISSYIGKLESLQFLFLQGNYLSGSIPSELGNFSQLKNLNSLSGTIPASLGQLSKLSSFNLSTNFLVGPIPSDGVLAKFLNDSFVENRELCVKPLQVCKSNSSDSPFSQPSAVQNQSKKKYWRSCL